MVFQTLRRLKEGLGAKVVLGVIGFSLAFGSAGCITLKDITPWEVLDIGAGGAALGRDVDERDRQRYSMLSDFAGRKADRESRERAARQQGLDAARGDYGDQNYNNLQYKLFTVRDINGDNKVNQKELLNKEDFFYNYDRILVGGIFQNAQGKKLIIDVIDPSGKSLFSEPNMQLIVRNREVRGAVIRSKDLRRGGTGVYKVNLYFEDNGKNWLVGRTTFKVIPY